VLNGELDVPRMTRSGMGLPEWHFSPSSRYKDDKLDETTPYPSSIGASPSDTW
jgi:hypothetical protein